MTRDEIFSLARHMYLTMRNGLARALRFLRNYVWIDVEAALRAIFQGVS